MKLTERIRKMIDGIPGGSSVVLPVSEVRTWLDEHGPGLDQDLTVQEVGELFHRSPVTIRSWIRDGRLRAYRLQGREYRITTSALKDFQEDERGRDGQ